MMPKTTKKKTTIKAPTVLAKKKPINKWLVASGVAVVALLGIVIIQFSHASNYTFIHHSNQTAGGSGPVTYGASSYRVIKPGQTVTISTLLSAAEMRNTKSVCYHWSKVSSSASSAAIEFTITSTLRFTDGVQYSKSRTWDNHVPPVVSSSPGCDIPGFSSYSINRYLGAGFSVKVSNPSIVPIGIDNLYGLDYVNKS